MIHNQTDRRGFLRRAMTGAAALVEGPTFGTRPSLAGTNQADVLIIGAGMSGVAAGHTLLSAGVSPIVLEGRSDRIGGRIWSSYAWADAPVDLGASWLTHAEINPLAEIARQAGIAMVPSDLMNLTLSTADGRILSPTEVNELWALYFATYAGVKAISLDRIARRLPDIPASRAFEAVLGQEQLSPDTLQKLEFFLNYAIKEPEVSPLCDLSLNYWDDDFVFVQLFTKVFPGGYVQLVQHLAAGLDIRMNHVVQEIDYGPQGVTVRTNQGEFQASYAIVTLPHGVLKSGAVTFSPPLPSWKQGAIQRLHTGLSDKFYLRFPRLFWNPEPDTLGRIAETEASPWSTWINFYKYTGIPMLMVFNHGPFAHHLEKLCDTQVMDTAMAVLRKQYGPGIPDPIGMQRSHWGADRFAHGTITHIPPGSSGADYGLMGRPVGPLRFAGDSTHEDFPTLVMGAFLSGVREAGGVLSLLGMGGPPAQDVTGPANVERRPARTGEARQGHASSSSRRGNRGRPSATRRSSSNGHRSDRSTNGHSTTATENSPHHSPEHTAAQPTDARDHKHPSHSTSNHHRG
jgi:monoamine oxidase